MLARCLLEENHQEDIRIFYSYSRANSEFRSQIDTILAQFKWDLEVRTWYDGEIPAGKKWENEIFRNIDTADIILLFISKEFLSSDYCVNTEMPRALKLHEEGRATIIPILVDVPESGWSDLPVLQLQALPNNGVPISKWTDKQKAIKAVIQGIVNIIVNSRIKESKRARWQLYLEGSLKELDSKKELELVSEVRKISMDKTARPIALGAGSIAMFMESSYEALTQFKHWFNEQETPMILGRKILQIIELFGAGIQASAGVVSNAHDNQEKINQQSDLLLFPSKEYVPCLIKGIEIPEDNSLNPHFIIDAGHSTLKTGEEEYAAEAHRMVEYFLTGIAVKGDELWVNLGPDQSNRMLGKSLEGTILGRDLLEFDFKLKRLAASLLHPDCETGKQFWKEVFKAEKYSMQDKKETYNTFQRVWVVPGKAAVYCPKEHNREAYIIEHHLKVLCEDDYLSQYCDGQKYNSNDICTPLFKEIVLPVIEDEINKGSNFYRNRQINDCMILATWFKKNFKSHPIWSKYIDTGNPTQLLATIGRVTPIDNLMNKLGLNEEGDIKESNNENFNQLKGTNNLDFHDQDTEDEKIFKKAVRCRETGKYEESRRLLEELVNRNIDLRGKSSQFTQKSMSQLGRTLRAMGQHDRAVEIHREVFDVRRYVLGANHPYTLNSMEILADSLEMAGDTKEAQTLRTETAKLRAQTGDAFNIKENREYHAKYMRIFREGVFNLVRDELCQRGEQNFRVTRSYFSGAIDFRKLNVKMVSFKTSSQCYLNDVIKLKCNCGIFI